MKHPLTPERGVMNAALALQSASFSDILHAHALWARGEPSGRRADLSKGNLIGMNFLGADLRRALLTAARCTRACTRSRRDRLTSRESPTSPTFRPIQ